MTGSRQTLVALFHQTEEEEEEVEEMEALLALGQIVEAASKRLDTKT